MPTLFQELAGQVGVRLRSQGGLLLVALQDCGTIVTACRFRRVLILGIEAFRFGDGKVVPEMDFIADFSELLSKQWDSACLEAARSAELHFGKAAARADLWFEFSLKARE